MMSLVRATKEDFATMVLQERHMHMFNNNLQASDGRELSQADRELKLRDQQEKKADEFVDILDDDYAIILEVIQSENPENHLPKAAEKHRPKKSTKASSPNSQKRKQKDDEMNKSKKIKMITPQHLQYQHNNKNQCKKYQLSNKTCNGKRCYKWMFESSTKFTKQPSP